MVELTTARDVAQLISHVGRVAYSGGRGQVLTAAQYAALRYFGQSNRFSRTTSAFAQFHGTTRGTASQTVKALVEHGYLSRTRSLLDGRRFCFDLTGQARSALKKDPLNDVAKAVSQLPRKARAAVARSLRQILAELARSRGGMEFGSCASCDHLERCEDGDTFLCRGFDEVVELHELQLLCSKWTEQRSPKDFLHAYAIELGLQTLRRPPDRRA